MSPPGVESRKGVKDAGLIRAFIAAAKGAAPPIGPERFSDLLLLRDFQFPPQPLDLRPKRLDL